jgi:hypothetical protein
MPIVHRQLPLLVRRRRNYVRGMGQQGPFENFTMLLPHGGYCPPIGVPPPAGMVPSGIDVGCNTGPGGQGFVYGPTQNPQAYGTPPPTTNNLLLLTPSSVSQSNAPNAQPVQPPPAVASQSNAPGPTAVLPIPGFFTGTLFDGIPNWVWLVGGGVLLFAMTRGKH